MRHQTDFDVTVQLARTEATVSIVGELDLCTARNLRCALARLVGGTRNAVVDLERLTFIDVAGLRALENARDELSRTGITVRFVNPPRSFTRIAEILDLDLHGDFRV